CFPRLAGQGGANRRFEPQSAVARPLLLQEGMRIEAISLAQLEAVSGGWFGGGFGYHYSYHWGSYGRSWAPPPPRPGGDTQVQVATGAVGGQMIQNALQNG